MRNIIMSIITFFLIIFIIVIMFKGVSIGAINIASIEQISDKSAALKQKVLEVNTLNNVMYKKNLSDLNDATKNLTTNKGNYLDIASTSSDSEIKEANQEQIYTMEYLWSKIGNHATDKGVNLKLEVTSSGSNNQNTLNFTVIGGYMQIRDFIYSLENDNDLNFKIENFNLTGQSQPTTQNNNQTQPAQTAQPAQQAQPTQSSSNGQLTCTFKVLNIEIKQENVPTPSSTTSTPSATTNNNTISNNTVSSTTGSTTSTTPSTNDITNLNSTGM